MKWLLYIWAVIGPLFGLSIGLKRGVGIGKRVAKQDFHDCIFQIQENVKRMKEIGGRTEIK